MNGRQSPLGTGGAWFTYGGNRAGLEPGARKGNSMAIDQFIENEVKSNDVVLFM